MGEKNDLIFVLIGFIAGLFAGICITLIIIKIAEKIAVEKYKREEKRRAIVEKKRKPTEEKRKNRKEKREPDLETSRELSEKEKMLEALAVIPVNEKEILPAEYNDNEEKNGDELRTKTSETVSYEEDEGDKNIIEELGGEFYKNEKKREENTRRLNVTPISFYENSLYGRNSIPQFKESRDTTFNSKFLLYKEKYLFLNWYKYNSKEITDPTRLNHLERCYKLMDGNEKIYDIADLIRNISVIAAFPAIVKKEGDHYILEKPGILKIEEVY